MAFIDQAHKKFLEKSHNAAPFILFYVVLYLREINRTLSLSGGSAAYFSRRTSSENN